MKGLKFEGQPVHAARIFSCLLLVILMLGMTVPSAQASGLYTHTWFVESAIQQLQAQGGRYAELVRILNKHAGVVNYGSLFPDITLSISVAGLPVTTIDDNWAEIAHGNTADGLTKVVEQNYLKYLEFLADKGYDKYNNAVQTAYYKQFLGDPAYGAQIPPFRAALIAEMADHFGNNPRNDDDERMIAFLFGVIAHQEADTPWHLDRPGCTNANYGGIGWGLECAAVKTKGYDNSIGELQLDNLLYHYDQGHLVAFDFLGTAKTVVYDAVDHAGIRRPNESCLFYNDAFDCGDFQMRSLWAIATEDGGANDANRDWLKTYVPGGLDNGSAFVAGSRPRRPSCRSASSARFSPPTSPRGIFAIRTGSSKSQPSRQRWTGVTRPSGSWQVSPIRSVSRSSL
jgi:hypothetical protein